MTLQIGGRYVSVLPAARVNSASPLGRPAVPWREVSAFMVKLRKRDGMAARARSLVQSWRRGG